MALSNVRFKGFKAFEVMTKTLPDKINKKLVRHSFKYALEPTKKAMQDNINKGRTGRLWYSVGITVSGDTLQGGAFAIVGPRRKKFSWDQQGWHSHLVEVGTKAHTITSKKGNMMPVFRKGSSGPVAWARKIEHKGSKAIKPFSRGIDSTWRNVNSRLVDKSAELMRIEIKSIFQQYGTVYTKFGDAL